MRNLKRALSLTLASVMLLGMMVVGSSAAAGYDDVDVNDNVEAIEVLQAVKVMVGDDRGFGPDRPVTRNEMAVVMGKLLNLDYNYYSASCPFTDVADWAKGWVGAAAANGIVSGRGNGIYDGEATVTAVEAASMMMRALGYFKYQNDYADGFQVATVRQGTKIGIFDQVGTDATSAMTRNQVAQMALNALQSGMVEPDGNTINLTTPDGSVFTGKVNYVYRTSAKDFAGAIGKVGATSAGSTNTGLIVELGEQLYNGDLKLYDDRTDDFGRPSRKWEYDGKAIGTYMKKELIDREWTNKVTGKDLYDLLGSDTIKNYDFQITIDGVDVDAEKTVMTDEAGSYFDATYMTKTWKEGVGQTGKGVLTQVFVDPDYGKYGKVWVSVINTYLAKATNDYNDKKDEISLDVYGLEKDTDSGVYYKYHDANGFAAKHDPKDSELLKAAGEDFSKVESMKKDDIVLVTVAAGDIKSVSDPQVLSAVELSEFSKYSYVINDGTKYEYNTTIDYDPDVLDDYTGASATQQLKDTEYNLFLDPYGYLIGVEVVEAAKNYIFLTGIDQGNSNLNAKVSDAAGILTDGTFLNFSMNMKDSKEADDTTFEGHALHNTWCTYTKDKDGVYTLKEVGDYDDVFPADDSVKPAKAGQFADFLSKEKEIDTKHVSLIGKGTYNAGANTLAADAYVYGNDNSVYILAETKEVTAKNEVDDDQYVADDVTATGKAVAATTEKVGVISGVDSVGVGIDNVSITTYEDADALKDAGDIDAGTAAWPGYIYTLFDDDGYVIAAIVLGEDSGTTKNLVYSHKDSVESEKYDKADDEWTWTRYVIKDGVEILLTQKGDDETITKGIEHLDENVWYEITYKADGTVKKAEPVFFTEYGQKVGHSTLVDTNKSSDGGVMFGAKSPNAGDFVYDIEELEYALNDGKNDGTTLYEEVWGDHDETIAGSETAVGGKGAQLKKDNAPSLVGSTLYVNTDAKQGFYVHKDVKSVLIQKNGGDKTTSYGSGTSDLESFLKDLNFSESKNTYLFKISAILTNGRATTVIIHDWVEGEKNHGTVNPKDDEEETGDIDVYVSYRTDAGDATTQLSEETFKMSRAKNGRLVLDKATATAKMGAAWKNYFEVTDTTFPKTLTVAEGTSFAETIVEVSRKTKTLTLPDDWKANWDTDAAKYVTALDDDFESDVAGDATSVEVPTGAAVTVTPVDTDCKTTHYLYNSNVAAAKQMAKGADGATVAAAWGKFNMPSDKNVELKADKYIKLDTEVTIGTETAEMGAIRLEGTVSDFGTTLVTANSLKYVKAGATDVKVTLKATNATKEDAASGDVYAKMATGMTGKATIAASVKIFENTKKGSEIAGQPITVTIVDGTANTGGDLKLAFDFANAA